MIEGMFKSWITNNCGFFASVLVIVYVLVVSSSTGDIIGLKIAEDAGPTVIPFPENLREGLKVCDYYFCCCIYWHYFLCMSGEVDGGFLLFDSIS